MNRPKLIIFLIFVLFARNNPAEQLEKNGYSLMLGISDKYALNTYGSPLEIQEYPSEDIVGMNITKVYIYKGATLDFHLRKNKYYLWRFQITTNKWAYISNITRVGNTVMQLSKALGKPATIESNTDSVYWFYPLPKGDGWVRVVLKNDFVVEILVVEDWT